MDELDEMISLMNQFTVDFGYVDETVEFSGVNGVLRFSSDDCPELLGWLSLQPELEEIKFN